MPIEPSFVELNWQAMGTISALVVAALGGIWAVGKVLIWQFNRSLKLQFDAVGQTLSKQNEDFVEMKRRQSEEFIDIKHRLDKQEDNDLNLEREMMALRAELPRDYVRREDFTRVIASFEVKVDNLRLSIERLLFRQGSN
jgi:hypothetical protein